MKAPSVTLNKRTTRGGEVSFTVYLNDVRLAGFNSHHTGPESYFWPFRAERKAEAYASRVADTLEVELQRIYFE